MLVRISVPAEEPIYDHSDNQREIVLEEVVPFKAGRKERPVALAYDEKSRKMVIIGPGLQEGVSGSQ